MSDLIDDDLKARLLGTFAQEAEERLQAIADGFLALEKQPTGEQVGAIMQSVFREAHTIKGGARSLELPAIEKVTHRLESLFGRLQNGQTPASPDVFDLVYRTLDALGLLLRAETTGEPAPVNVPLLCDDLERIGNGSTALPPVPASTPVSTETAAPASSPETTSRLSDDTVRVAVAKLDALMAQVGELQVARIGLEQQVTEVGALFELFDSWEPRWRRRRARRRRAGVARENSSETVVAPVVELIEEADFRLVHARLDVLRRRMRTDGRRLAQVVSELQDEVHRVRMLPLATVFGTFPRMVRDLARSLNKEVSLTIVGGEIEADRTVLERLTAPLIHLLRNSMDHGIEVPNVRQAAGKPQQGTITLTASQRGSSMVIEIADDGVGIDVAKVRASAAAKGHLTTEAAAALTDVEARWLIFRSGISTKNVVSDLSGRGVGLDMVRDQIERLHGLIDVESQPGKGTRFALTVPLSVATTLCLLVRAAQQTFALPLTNVIRLVRLRPGQIGRASGREVVVVDDRPLPVSDLFPGRIRESGGQLALIVGWAEKRLALLVDEVLGADEVVIRSLPRPLNRVRQVAGATILGSGQIVIVPNLAEWLPSGGGQAARPAEPSAAETPPRTRVILVADDSVTTRTLEKNILEAAGYEVRVAADGLEAWKLLKAGTFDLLLSDVNMPNLDGIGLTERVRADEQLRTLPVVLVTSLASTEDRERGVRAGADAYIVKGSFEQDKLLGTIRQLI